MTSVATPFFSDTDRAAFRRDGFLVVKKMVDDTVTGEMRRVAMEHLREQRAPIEYEIEVGYPGAPTDASSEGAETPRRLLHAYARHEAFRQWATGGETATRLQALLDSDDVLMSQCHHNCIMTKHPGHSSATLWHQDNRYWSFDEQNLVSTWLALGDETRENGCLRVIPGSHHLALDPGRFDAALFLRTDLSENKSMLANAVAVELERGDVLFFHSRLFHAAGRNLSAEPKLSVVFTYHTAANHPIADTRSARFPGIPVGG